MSSTVFATAIPISTRIAEYAKGAYFADAWSVVASEPELTALGQYIKAASSTPSWVETCMKLRNIVVQFVGLKNLGGLAELAPEKKDFEYKAGDRLGIFTLLEITPDEVLMGDDDKHLKVVLSVSRQKQESGKVLITIATVVHLHNLLGKIYMLPVVPMHKLIAPAVARAIGGVA